MTILEPILGESRALAIAGHLSGAWRTRRRVLRGVATALQTVNRDHKLNIILVPHYFDDYRAMTTLIGEMKPQFAHQQTISTGLATVPHVQWFYGRYCKADLAISMRVHSMSPALGLGVPTIPIVTQRRLSAFLEDAGLSDVAVDAFAPDMADRLVAAIRRSIAAPQERRERALAAKARFREQYRVYNRKVAGLLGA
jgi:polysaccharide pyruvyl transferase WcaK-like protein